MRLIKIWNDSPAENQLNEITDALDGGALIIMPTDSVYAIVCDALNIKAINRLCKLKGINPEKNHLSIICSDISMAAEYTRIEDEAFDLIKRNTPGPFTFLLPAGRQLPKAFKGRKAAGVRIPDCNVTRMVAQRLGRPLLTTSIEFKDQDHAREPELIAERYDSQDVDMIVDGGEGNTELSTIVDCTGSEPEIIRFGCGNLQ